LSLIGAALDSDNEPGKNNRHFDGEELIRVVLQVYADPLSTQQIRQSSVDVFDKLMNRYSGWAYRILEEWDRA
jgi:hypothetical protein